ncbi:MAG TPA: SusC/RagA family TonB-linked outer membrane protein [Anaerovoracaceae bacterium]|nr:SusC/RagA family TonB-linked outer membrane protein [Anaerovoracaceae bacterium]
MLLTIFTTFDLSATGYSADDQQQTVTGVITESQTGERMPGVNVLIKGSTTGTISDANGKYSINVTDPNTTLVFSFIGYVSREIPLEGKSTVDVLLIADILNLDEVVVIGYGSQRRVTLTGSVASVSSKEISKTPTTNVSNALAGILPGVITKNTSGEPGRDDNLILIRGRNTTGSTSPLIVVDGIQDATGWERINSNDIESISVLKDASASIYGARAANGVILITTKRGSLGKPSIQYSFNQGIKTPTRLPKMASSAEFAGYVNQLDIEAGNTPRYSDAEIQKFRDGSDPNYIDEDWYARSLRKYTFMEQQNLAIRGGSENIKYSASGSYSNEDGIFKNSSLNYKTYGIRSNLDAIITKYLSIGIDLNGGLQNGNYPGGGSNFGSLKQIPFVPVFWPNGLPSAGIENGNNPIIQANAVSGNRNIKEYILLAKSSFNLIIPWVKGLGIDGYYAYTANITADKNWQLPWDCGSRFLIHI